MARRVKWAQDTDERERSRARIIDALDDCPDLTLIGVPGGREDELRWSGAQALLSDRRYRAIGIDELCASAGKTAVLCGCGSFSAAARDWVPRALTAAEQRFEHVVVLPSSFDVDVSEVREVLMRTHAVVFARESRSFDAIRGLCDARLALDPTFFLDYAELARHSAGTVDADVGACTAPLREWLEHLADHAVVRTGNPAVMIAACSMGKQVELGPEATWEAKAIAEDARLPVTAQPEAREARRSTSTDRRPARRGSWRRVTVASAADIAACSADGFPRTEYVLLLDPEVTVSPGATERLVEELDARPEAVAAAPSIVDAGGVVHVCGGDLRERDDVIEFRVAGHGVEPGGGVSSTCDWVPFSAALVKTSALDEFPLDPEMAGWRVAAEWSYRVSQARGGGLRRCVEARVEGPSYEMHLEEPADFRSRCRALPALASIAAFTDGTAR